MKTMNVKTIMLTMLLAVLFTFASTAQPPAGKSCKQICKQSLNEDDMQSGCCGIPNLSDEQKQKMKDLHTKLMKEILPIKNEIGEKEAKLRTLSTADTPDINAINQTIDEISALQAKIMKKKAAHHQEIRKLLTEEQRIIFDTKKSACCGSKKATSFNKKIITIDENEIDD